MRVVHVVRAFHPAVGGLEGAVLSLARHQLARQGIGASVVTLDRLFSRPGEALPHRDHVDGVRVTRLPWRGSTRYPLAPSVLSHLADADIVHVHAIDFFFDFLALAKPLHRRTLVASTHGGFFHTAFAQRLKTAYFNTVTRTSAMAYAAIVACSQSDAASFERIAPNNLVTIENGVDLGKFAGRSAARHTRRIIYFGRFASHKRIEALFDLLRRLLATDPGWQLVVAGGAADVSVATLKAAAADLGPAVRFVIDPSEAALAEAIGTASYYACASSHEGFGLAAVEALSAGLVPVLSDIPPFARLQKKAGVGMLFDPADIPQAAARLVALDDALATAGPQERQRAMAASAAYDWDTAADAYLSVYRTALAPRRRTEIAASNEG